jgi:hypothetical protein
MPEICFGRVEVAEKRSEKESANSLPGLKQQ